MQRGDTKLRGLHTSTSTEHKLSFFSNPLLQPDVNSLWYYQSAWERFNQHRVD